MLQFYKQVFNRSNNLYDKYNACWHLVDEYKSFQYDSAFHYSQKLSELAYQINQSEFIETARIKTAFVLESGGLLKEAADTLEVVDLTGMPDSIKSEYNLVTIRYYDFMANFVHDSYYAKIYQQKSKDLLKETLDTHSPSSLTSYFIKIQINQATKDFTETERIYLEMVENFELTNHQLAMRTNDIAGVFVDVDLNKSNYYRALSAIYDIRGAVKENVAMRELAESLFRQGDLLRASMLIKQALEDANFYSSRLRKVEVSDMLPIIEGKQYQELQGRNQRVTAYSYIITLLVIILTLFLFIIFRQLKKLRVSQHNLDNANETLFITNNKLEESNKIKEAYIGQFFNMISEHLFKTEKLVTAINRKLSQRKFEDLSEITDSINSFKERDLLYKDFDDKFLSLFPDFIPKLNQLLKKDEQLDPQLKLLTPDIRIYALLRLGISDNNEIARFLNYSINTIYTYKTRLKSKAIDPEAFEDAVINI